MPSYQDLALEIAAQASTLRLRINGTSMAPLMQDGESVIVEPTPFERLQRGDVIAFRHSRQTITHRIIALEPSGVLTLGDNLRKLDPPVPSDMILGRVVALEKNGRAYPLSTGGWPLVHRTLAGLGGRMVAPHASKWISRAYRLLFWFVRKSARTLYLF
ncbi:MAG: S26 family signal peptidase [Anaerolineales bacterium]|nr:S26 family signal peptidase [Anaerolineales bacterium]